MEERDHERRLLSNRIEELERLDSELQTNIIKEKAQYNVLIYTYIYIQNIIKKKIIFKLYYCINIDGSSKR